MTTFAKHLILQACITPTTARYITTSSYSSHDKTSPSSTGETWFNDDTPHSSTSASTPDYSAARIPAATCCVVLSSVVHESCLPKAEMCTSHWLSMSSALELRPCRGNAGSRSPSIDSTQLPTVITAYNLHFLVRYSTVSLSVTTHLLDRP